VPYPLFVDPQDVMLRMQLDAEISGMADTVANAIRGASLQIEALIGYTITRRHQRCMYYLDSDAFSGIQPNGQFKLEVPSGLIRKDSPLIVRYSEQTNQQVAGVYGNDYGTLYTDAEGPFGTMLVADTTWTRIDWGRGYVLLAASRYADRYVEVECDTGYETGTNPMPVAGLPLYDPTVTYQQGDQVNYQGIAWTATVQTMAETPGSNASWNLAYLPLETLPDNLAEAIMMYVPTIFDSSQITNRSKDAEPMYKKAEEQAMMLLNPYLRVTGFAFRPMWVT
jgi:hypothetical protein